MTSPAAPSIPVARLQRAFATATTCAFAGLPCAALGFAAPAVVFAAAAGAAAVWGWAGLGPLAEREQERARLLAERERLISAERAQALRAEAAELRLRRMGERVRELYFEFDAEGRRFVYLSPVFETLFGVESGSAYADAQRVFECFDEARQQTLARALSEGTAGERLRLEFKTPAGFLRRVSLRVEVDPGDARLLRGTLTLMRVGAGLALAGPTPEPALPQAAELASARGQQVSDTNPPFSAAA